MDSIKSFFIQNGKTLLGFAVGFLMFIGIGYLVFSGANSTEGPEATNSSIPSVSSTLPASNALVTEKPAFSRSRSTKKKILSRKAKSSRQMICVDVETFKKLKGKKLAKQNGSRRGSN